MSLCLRLTKLHCLLRGWVKFSHIDIALFVVTNWPSLKLILNTSPTSSSQTQQEGWLSPTERASVSAISLMHILASVGYAPGIIAVNVTQMKRGFNACQNIAACTQLSSTVSRIQPVSSKVRHFSTFLHILASTGYAPGTIAVNVTWMERRFNAGQTHSSIYPFIFNRLRAIARYWSEIATFSYPFYI